MNKGHNLWIIWDSIMIMRAIDPVVAYCTTVRRVDCNDSVLHLDFDICSALLPILPVEIQKRDNNFLNLLLTRFFIIDTQLKSRHFHWDYMCRNCPWTDNIDKKVKESLFYFYIVFFHKIKHKGIINLDC